MGARCRCAQPTTPLKPYLTVAVTFAAPPNLTGTTPVDTCLFQGSALQGVIDTLQVSM